MCPAKPELFAIWPFSENVKKKLLYQVHKMFWCESLYYLEGLHSSRSVEADNPSPEEIKIRAIFLKGDGS